MCIRDRAALNPVLIALVALAGIATVVASNWQTFSAIFQSLWLVIRASVGAATNFIIDRLNDVIGLINRTIRQINRLSGVLGLPSIGEIATVQRIDISGGVGVGDAARGAGRQFQAIDFGELLSNARDSLGGLLGGGGDTNITIQGDVFESEETNDRLVREIERAVRAGKLATGQIGPNANPSSQFGGL